MALERPRDCGGRCDGLGEVPFEGGLVHLIDTAELPCFRLNDSSGEGGRSLADITRRNGGH